MKKSISFFDSIIMIICILITSASANEYDRQQEHQNVITDFHYIVYDKNGNVIDEGNIPGKNSRVIWEGITLDNGDTLKLTKSNGDAFAMLADVRYDYSIDLNHKATLYHYIFMSNQSASQIIEIVDSWTTTTPFHSRAATMSKTGYYYFTMTNYSSESVTINEVELVF